jgi:hypothetical protein
MTLVRGGRAFYGQPIGILMSDAVVPRLPGDIGNGFTFDFPVRYRVVTGATWDRYATADPTLLAPFIAGARELEAEGVRAITASCGFVALFQRELADAVRVPVFASSLIQVPMVAQMLRQDQQVGILTADSRRLTARHLEACGIRGVPVVIWGAERAPAFYDTFVRNTDRLDYAAARRAVVEMVRELVRAHPRVGAIVCEGSNFALFRPDVQRALGIPFFDIVTLTRMVFQAVSPGPAPADWGVDTDRAGAPSAAPRRRRPERARAAHRSPGP